MRKQMPTESAETKVFPVKALTIDTFDIQKNGISEQYVKLKEPLFIVYSPEGDSLVDGLRKVLIALVKQKLFIPEKTAVICHVKTSRYKGTNLSCLYDLGGTHD